MRTVQTANIFSRFHNTKIIKDPLLTEIDQGIFTGRHKESYSELEKQLKLKCDESCGMESYQSVESRLKEFIEKIKPLSYKNILIITHNVSASLLERIILNKPIDFSNDKHLRNFKNAEIKKFTLPQ